MLTVNLLVLLDAQINASDTKKKVERLCSAEDPDRVSLIRTHRLYSAAKASETAPILYNQQQD